MDPHCYDDPMETTGLAAFLSVVSQRWRHCRQEHSKVEAAYSKLKQVFHDQPVDMHSKIHPLSDAPNEKWQFYA